MSTRLIWLVSLLPAIAQAQNFPNPEPNCLSLANAMHQRLTDSLGDGSVKPLALPYKNVTVVPYYLNKELVSAHKCFAITFGDGK
jgi:hypothetical protein